MTTQRFRKPQAKGFTSFSQKVVDSGDGVWYPFVGGFVTVVDLFVAVPTSVIAGPVWSVLFSVPAFYFSTIIGYLRGTQAIEISNAKQYKEALNKVFPKITGPIELPMAQSLMENIFTHTVDGHPGGNLTWPESKCKICAERLQLLKELAPNQITNQDDIERVKMYLEAKEDISGRKMIT